MRFRRDFLTLSRREQTAFLTLIVMLQLLIGGLFIRNNETELIHDQELEDWVSEVNELNRINNKKVAQADFFIFNPNIVSGKELMQLGFNEKVVTNLLKYRKAGGKINSFSKFESIYGIDSSHLSQLKPYIVYDTPDVKKNGENDWVSNDFKIDLNSVDSSKLINWSVCPPVVADILLSRKDNYYKQRFSRDSLRAYSLDEWKKLKLTSLVPKRANLLNDDFIIELNQADTAELVVLHGIGSVLARRIIYYRARLGGFYDVEQLLEVEGISPVVLSDNEKHLEVDPNKIKPLDINEASLKRMKNHPYFDFYMAKDIYEFRKNDGVITNFQTVFKLPSFANKDTSLIKRYIRLQY